ncbi:MAG: sulfotransferase [Pseudohongiella sp.]|nr:sulfotransferase [Pseudohongiella sp.]
MKTSETLATSSGDMRTWQLASQLAADSRNWPELRRIATSWTQTHPSCVEAWRALSRGYFEDSHFNEAISAYSHILDLEPGNASHLVSAARLATAGLQHESARSYLMAAEALAPDSGEVLYALSRLYHLTGELDKAEDYCRRAIRVLPGFVPAYTALGLLTEGRLTESEIAMVVRLINMPGLHPEYRAMLCFTLGDALDRKGDYAQAFAAWGQANAINSQISAQEGFVYDAAQHEADVIILEQLFNESFASENTLGDGVKPIFVLGMPRSGTTLVESILASHSAVYGAGELPTLPAIYEELMDIARRQGIAAAQDAVRTRAHEWRARYLAALPSSPGCTYTVDKQPLNYRCIGLIRLLFPDAPIIYTQRSAEEVALSIYRHNFSKNWPCAHKLSDIRHYFGVHQRMVALWQTRHPDAIHVLDHIALVEDPDAEIRSLLAFTGLPLEPACLTPHKTKRRVATFSSVQVQRPVSASYTGRAALYAAFLGGDGGIIF